MFPASDRIKRSRCRSHDFLPGMIERFFGCRDECERVVWRIAVRSCWRSSRAVCVKCEYAAGELLKDGSMRNYEVVNPVEDWRTYQETLIASLPPSRPSVVASIEIDSTSSFVAAKISVPPPLSFTFLPMDTREEPFARSAVPVSKVISLKSARSRPSARWGGLCLRPVAM